ncbi:D-isomer specific 2-hydroxyacid dehydrogenase [Dendryphion nanum]|uniref:D-isomer specific 2-hydroxyacid dehydrogenase n=1 Tax=Dendryphion nanum TaxID=256645 RepID=A0A9P9IMS0_9PLEO|nr:D-isomer specific 2-hydroxyacid dehydrogenase [Dendryphion nanum]
MQHHIVALERIHQPLQSTFSFPHTLTTYEITDPSDHDAVVARIAPATILVVTITPITAALLDPHVSPNLRLIAVMATGTDCVDLEAARARGIRVTNSPAANLDAVSEHAISLYFAARRRTVLLDRATREVPSEWITKGSLTGRLRFSDGRPPLTCGDEVLGIVGYGGLGKRIASFGKALGMQVLVSARKGTEDPPSNSNVEGVVSRVPFTDVLRRSTVIVLSLPRTPETINLFSAVEFAAMSPYAVLINISRGGIVDELAVVEALKGGEIAGYATDVFNKEPPTSPADCALLSEEAKDLNITISPHLAWFSQRTLDNLGRIHRETVEAWVNDKPINVIV